VNSHRTPKLYRTPEEPEYSEQLRVFRELTKDVLRRSRGGESHRCWNRSGEVQANCLIKRPSSGVRHNCEI